MKLMRFLTILLLVFFLAMPAGAFTNNTIGQAPPDNTPYDATTWNGSLRSATKNAIRDALESIITPENTVSVAISGGDYDTIQGALDVNGANTLIIVYPGTYTDDTIHFTADNQYIVGAQSVAPKLVLVTKATNILDVGAFTGCIVDNVKMVMTLAANAVDTTVKGSGSCNFKFCHIECVVSGTNADTGGGATAFRGTADFKIVEGSIIYTNTANRAARGKKAILVEAGSSYIIDDVTITVTGSGTSSAHAVIRDNSTGELLIDKCTITNVDNATDKTYGLNIDNGSGEPEVSYNSIHVSNSTGDATAIRIGSTSTLSVRSMYNHFSSVAGSGTAYVLEIDDANTTAISQFDDLVSADGVLNSGGKYTRVNSPSDGDFDVSGVITSTQATGTSPFTIASTTVNTNLNADKLDGADWAAPAALGSGTPAAVAATTVTASGAVTGINKWEADITGNISLNTAALHSKMYLVTAVAIATIDAAADAGYGAPVLFRVRDGSEVFTINPDDAEIINLHGTALDAGDSIDSPGQAGDQIVLVATTDADGSGTDGWMTMGYVGGDWADGD